jgi:hypothetical protein
MALGFAIASSVLQIGGAIAKGGAQRAAAEEQYKLDLENIEFFEEELGEKIGRTERENLKTEGLAKVQVGASGFKVGSSLDQYVEKVKAEHASDLDWMRTSGATKVGIMEREASARKRTGIATSQATTISGIGAGLGTIGGAL